MEENSTPIVEENGPDQGDVFDGWEAGESPTADQPEREDAAQTEQQTEDQQTEPEAPPEEPGREPEQEEQRENPKDDTFLTLKHLDEVRTVTREEARELAEKGLDYDRVLNERDSLRAFREENSAAIDLVQKYAARNNMSVAEYLDYCRTQELMTEQSITPEAAKAQVELEKREMEVARKEEEQAAREQAQAEAKEQTDDAQERVRREVAQFLADYPEVKPEEVPPGVFETAARDGVTLSVAYGKWRIAEQAKELEAMRAQADARKKSPGSLSGSLPAPKTDPAFDGWE